jgi:hypothetical protein
MIVQDNSENGPVIRAAKMAMETGNASYILIWLPKEAENTLKNLLERTYCENRTRKNTQNHSIDWYFKSVNRLHSRYGWPDYPGMKFKETDEKTIVMMVERAFETGNFEEINTLIPHSHSGDVQERFHNVMINRNYSVDDVVAGRAYVSVYIAFIVYLQSLFSGSTGNPDRMPNKE